jgi:hypothetical protein
MSGKHPHDRTGNCPNDLPHEESRVAGCRRLVVKGTWGNICSTENCVDKGSWIILSEILGHQVMAIGDTASFRSQRG